jgi:hypothetical protein
VAAVLFAAVVAVATEAGAESGPERAANQALTRGDALLRQGRHQEAIDTWRAGLRAMPHWVLMLRIGNAYRQLGRCDQALAYYNVGYAWRDASFTDAMLPPLEAAIEECRRELPARLEISADHGDATVSVDDHEVGITPFDPLEVEPGDHTVRAERDGFAGSETTVGTSPGTTTFVRLTLTPERPAPWASADAYTPADTAEQRARRRRGNLWGGVLLGAGLLAAGGGAALTALDGTVVDEGQGVSSLGPGVALVSLGGALVAGSIALFVAHPPAQVRERERERERERQRQRERERAKREVEP